MNKILKAQRIVVVVNAMQKTSKGYKTVGWKCGTLDFLDDKPYMGKETRHALRSLSSNAINELAREFDLAQEGKE